MVVHEHSGILMPGDLGQVGAIDQRGELCRGFVAGIMEGQVAEELGVHRFSRLPTRLLVVLARPITGATERAATASARTGNTRPC